MDLGSFPAPAATIARSPASYRRDDLHSAVARSRCIVRRAGALGSPVPGRGGNTIADVARSDRVGGKLEGSTPDVELIAAAGDGDAGAFEQLVGRHLGVLRAACSSVTLDPLERDDALQVALVDLWRGCGGFRGDAKASTWIYAIARSAALRVVRRRWPEHVSVRADLADLAATPPHWEDLSSTRQVVVDAIAALPVDQREALLLHVEGGMKYEEIAELKIAAVGTVKSWVSRARASIRTAIEESGRG
jgi:RNA polymerase sigma factor (sigma-70 family)